MAFGQQVFDNVTKIPRRRQLVVGTRKVLFDSDVPGCCVLQFKEVDKDNPDKIYTLSSQAAINNRLSEILFTHLGNFNIQTHLIRRINLIEQLVHAGDTLPLRVTVHNMVTPELAERMNLIPETFCLEAPLTELTLKTEKRDYPVVSSDHVTAFGWASEDELETIQDITLRVNDFLYGYFIAHGFKLARLHLEFARVISTDEDDYIEDSDLMIVDELNLNTVILQDIETSEFISTHNNPEAFNQVARRLSLLTEEMV